MATEQRLIDANAEVATIKEHYCKNCDSYNGVLCRSCWVDDGIGFLEDATTVDAVEVVRCKDCRYFDGVLGRCDNHDFSILPNEFCSYGERRTDHV